ncbi:MAG: NfeD family protein [Lachnospiraceae bacterium]|nr:NfeD family protein [Lachnospiraceae bacterium]
MEIYWLIAAGVLIVLEMITLGLTSIWFAGGCLVGFLAAFLGASLVVQIILCLVVSIVLLIFTRPVAEKYLNKSRTKTNVDELVGKTGKVLEEIDNRNERGKILLNGMEWTARGEADTIISKDTEVVVKEIVGAHAVVAEK